MTQEKKTWALLELFGHQRIAGEISEAEFGAGQILRVDVPETDRPALTKYFNVKAVYAITPCDESTVRIMAKELHPEPVSEYSIDRMVELRKRLPAGSEEEIDAVSCDI